ncbi:MAG TPA: MarR family transcriptional regulator [Nocardioides sp.]|jgi:DNA-binding MarR family transcriptional regulator|nr:MarR family transcriptional regulator [Nocardioides sp.]
MSTPTRDDSLSQLEREVGVLIRRVKRVIGVRSRAVHADLQPSSYLLLSYLAERGPMRSSAIAESFDIDKGAVSRQVQHLTDLGLVVRAPDPGDGRASLVSASEDAVRRLADVAQHRRKALDERLGQWTDEDLTDLVQMLGRYNATLE